MEAVKEGVHTALSTDFMRAKATYFSTVFQFLIEEAIRLASGDVSRLPY